MRIEFTQPVTVSIDTYGGGTHALHYQISINGEFVADRSGNMRYFLERMFPDNEELMAWIIQVENDDKTAYRQGLKLEDAYHGEFE